MNENATAPMTKKEVLTRARAKLAQGWTQAAFARDTQGEETTAVGNEAVCWCVVGAIQAVAPDDGDLRAKARDHIVDTIAAKEGDGDVGLTDWNDAPHRTKDGVLEVLDLAIATA